MNIYKISAGNKKPEFTIIRLSYYIFGAFLLTASMNQISIYRNFTLPDLFLFLSLFIIVTGSMMRGIFPISVFTRDNYVSGPAFLFIFSCLLAILVGPKFDFLKSLLVLSQFIFIFFVMSPVFVFYFQRQPGQAIQFAERIGILILISGLLACTVAILREYTGISLLNANVTNLGRHGSYMQGPGNFSQYLVLVWPLGLHFFLNGIRGTKFLGVVALPVLISGVFLSASRFAFVAIPLISCLYLGCCAFYIKQGWKKFLYTLVITLMMAVLIWVIYFFVQSPSALKTLIETVSINSAMEKKLLSFYNALKGGGLEAFDIKRTFQMKETLDFLSSIPVLGIGLGNAIHVMGFRVHMSLFMIWIEGGMLALVSIIIIFWRVIKSGIRSFRNCNSYREVSLASALIASCFAGFLMCFRTPMVIQNRYYWIPCFIVLLLPSLFKKRTEIE